MFGRLSAILLFLYVGPAFGQLPIAQNESAANDVGEQRLASQGIDASVDGIRNFLREMSTSEFDDRMIGQLIDKLDSPVYTERIQSQRRLICQPRLPLERLEKASRSESREKAYRVHVILQTWMPAQQALVQAALSLISRKKYVGLAKEVFAVVHVFKDAPSILRGAETAIHETVLPLDADFLKSQLDDQDPRFVRLAMIGLVQLAATFSGDELLQWARNRKLDEQARLIAAQSVVDSGDRRALPVFVELLGAQDVRTAARSNLVLRKLTGQKTEFSLADDASRSKGIEQWRQWIEEHGNTFKMQIPLANVTLGRSSLNGHTLIASGYRNEVIELDGNGNVVWNYTAPGAWSAEKMSNGDVLIASYQLNKVIEVSPEKAIVWDFDLPGVLNARPLDNGNILASSHSENRVVEVDRNKRIVWTYTAKTQCHDAIRLDNGNTLICTNDDVLEVDPTGNVVWSFPAEQAYGIDSLPSGNVLIAKLNGSVIEVDRQSNAILWTYHFPSPVDVYRTEEGNTLITGSQSAVEIDSDKKTVWTRDNMQFGSVRK